MINSLKMVFKTKTKKVFNIMYFGKYKAVGIMGYHVAIVAMLICKKISKFLECSVTYDQKINKAFKQYDQRICKIIMYDL